MPPSSPPFVKTYPVNLAREPGMPTGIHDPAWKDPAVATKVGLDHYARVMSQGLPRQAFQTVETLAPMRRGAVETRSFVLTTVTPLAGGVRVRAGSYGEIHRRYSFGGRLPPANFHAMAVGFGVDSLGQCFLKALVGRMDGGWGNRAALSVVFASDQGELGGISWVGELDPPGDKPVLVLAQDKALKDGSDALTTATVTFQTVHGTR